MTTEDDPAAEAARVFPYGAIPTIGDYQQDVYRKIFVLGALWAMRREDNDA